MEDTKRGRKAIAPTTPDALWDAFERYRNECIEDAQIDTRTGAVIPMPLTWVGFMDSLGLGYRPARFKEYYRAKGEFWEVIIARIENAIERNQLQGALLGNYNANLVARLNGYTDKTETETKHKGSITINHTRTGYEPASSEEEVLKREGIDGIV